jgi:hypothetical protein
VVYYVSSSTHLYGIATGNKYYYGKYFFKEMKDQKQKTKQLKYFYMYILREKRKYKNQKVQKSRGFFL